MERVIRRISRTNCAPKTLNCFSIGRFLCAQIIYSRVIVNKCKYDRNVVSFHAQEGGRTFLALMQLSCPKIWNTCLSVVASNK